MILPVSNFTHVACNDVPLPRLEGSTQLKLWHLLSLTNSRSGVILSSDGTRISVPFTAERDIGGFRLRSHFPAYRQGLVEQIQNQARLEVLFDCGEYYVDPEWILVARPHAPTEIKVVFTVEGAVRFVECSKDDAVLHLDRVTRFRQLRFHPCSQFSVWRLPDEYYADQLPQILHLEVDVEQINVSQVMALLHLVPAHRAHIIQKLEEREDPQSKEAAQIMSFFPVNE